MTPIDTQLLDRRDGLDLEDHRDIVETLGPPRWLWSATDPSTSRSFGGEPRLSGGEQEVVGGDRLTVLRQLPLAYRPCR